MHCKRNLKYGRPFTASHIDFMNHCKLDKLIYYIIICDRRVNRNVIMSTVLNSTRNNSSSSGKRQWQKRPFRMANGGAVNPINLNVQWQTKISSLSRLKNLICATKFKPCKLLYCFVFPSCVSFRHF